MAFLLKYNGALAPSFLKVTGVDQYILPEVVPNTFEIPSMYGNVDGGVSLGSRIIKVNYIIKKDSTQDDSYYIDKMHEWLIGDGYRPSKLELDRTGEYYLARPTGSLEVSDSIVYGSGTIEFLAANPRRYSANKTNVALTIGGTKNISYSGLVPVNPVFYFTCANTNSIKVTNTTTGDSFTINGALNGAVIIDCNKKFVSVNGDKRGDLIPMESDWITLMRGTNNINVTSTGTAPTEGSIEYYLCK